jgi:hypothetical protein
MKNNLFSFVFVSAMFVLVSLVGATNLRAQGDDMRKHGGDREGSQKSVASKSASFGTVAKSDKAYTSAIDAHDLKAAAKMIGHDGAFRGKVAKLYTPRGGSVVILNFDDDYKTALTAVLKRSDFSKFPDLSQLEGKNVVVSGTFDEFKGTPEIVLTDPKQIALVTK